MEGKAIALRHGLVCLFVMVGFCDLTEVTFSHFVYGRDLASAHSSTPSERLIALATSPERGHQQLRACPQFPLTSFIS